mmetsp:Transcript_106837/g.189878  ORF Transcript_106837/g.189878 Transcript_106837/m.189878 type:complete len:268 (-) Transcript_106837:439-1242(-)
MSHQGAINVAPVAMVLPIPLNRLGQPLLKVHLLLPAQRPQLVRVQHVPQVIEGTVHNVFDELILLVVALEDLEQLASHLNVGHLGAAANVVHLANGALVQHNVKCCCHVLDVQKVARVEAITVQGEGQATEHEVDKLGNDLLGVLVGAVHVVAARDDDWEVEGASIGLDQVLGASLGGRVRIGGLQLALLCVCRAIASLAVHLVSADMNEELDGVGLGCLQQHVGAQDVVLGKGEGVAKRVVNVSLGRKVEHSVYMGLGHHVVDQVW